MRVGVEQPAHRRLQPARVPVLGEGAPRVGLDEALHVDVRAAAAPRQQPRIVPAILEGGAQPAMVRPAWLGLGIGLGLGLGLALALGLGLALALGLGLRLDGPAGPRARRGAART